MTEETEANIFRVMVISMRISNGIISFLAGLLLVLLTWSIVNINKAPVSPFVDGVEYTISQWWILYHLASVCAVVSCQVMAVVLMLQRMWPLPNHPQTSTNTMSSQEEMMVRLSYQVLSGKLLSAYLVWNALVVFLVPPMLCGNECESDLVASIILWALPSSATTALMVISKFLTSEHARSREYEVTSQGLVPVHWWTQWGSKTFFGKLSQAIFIGAIIYQLVMAVMYGKHWIDLRSAELNIAIYSSETGYIAGFLVVLTVGLGTLGPSVISFAVLAAGQLVLTVVNWNVYHQMMIITSLEAEGGEGTLTVDKAVNTNGLHSAAILSSSLLGVHVLGLCLQIPENRRTRNGAAALEPPNEKSRLV